MMLIDKIVDRAKHWSTRLLSYAGRLQLLKSISFAITNYWLQCIPLPKFVIKKINSICRTFLWTGSAETSKKSLVAWSNVCKPIKNGGLNVIDLEIWNTVTMLKLLWNLCRKADSLWVRWVHTYYFKNKNVMEENVKPDSTWIMKSILNNREKVPPIQGKWEDMMMKERFCMTDIYMELRKKDGEVMPWRKLMYCNAARPRAVMTLWLTCHQKLATKTRLVRYGMVANNTCCFCDAEETTAHLFFGCATMRKVWKDILVWIGFHHEPDTWDREIIWLLRYGSGKGWKAALLRLAVTETIYGLWNYRNEHCFGKPKDIDTIRNNIINMITYRDWYSNKIRARIAELML